MLTNTPVTMTLPNNHQKLLMHLQFTHIFRINSSANAGKCGDFAKDWTFLDIAAWSSSNSSLVLGFIASIPKAVLVSATLTTPTKTNQWLVNK